ncbi:MAG TPA: CBS domain-containing protein [Longimicrobiaceae bacterium]|nr:CBS domain-containing protein [Longimicrobiaceae bacterium]
MRLAEILRPEHVVAPLAGDTVHDAVVELTRRLVGTGVIDQPDRLKRLFTESRVRELVQVGDRVVLPHLRTDAVARLVVAVGIAPRGLRAGPGGAAGTAQVVVLVLAAPSAADLYLQTVAAIARVLRHDSVVDRLVEARTPEAVLEIPEIRAITIQPRLTVRDVMTPRVYRVGPDEPVQTVLDLIAEHRLRAVPVVSAEREVLGMVTDRDLLRHFLAGVQRPGEAPSASTAAAKVRDVMSRAVICVSEDQALAEVTSIMVSKDLERLPVTSEGKLTGFLTRGDVLRKLFAFP